MIDKVQRALETMAPELASYKIRNIFTAKQINKIIENRRRFENKLQRTSKRLNDFLQYAHSEIKLEKIRNKKISEMGSGLEESDLLLQINVIKIYENAMHCFNEPILVKEFSEYCIKKKASEKMKNIFGLRCLKNLKDSDLWIYCAQQLWKVDDAEGARGLFMKGISVNLDPKLYVEFFRFEILFAKKLNQINKELGVEEEERDDIEKGRIAFIVLKDLVDRFGNSYESECMEIVKDSEFENEAKGFFTVK